MRTLLWVILLGSLALSGCVRKKVVDSGSRPQPRAGSTPLTVTPEIVLVAKVVGANKPGRFVVLNFPRGQMASPEQHLNLYRKGLKVGEVKVTGPQQDDNTVADIVAGEAEVGDDARSQ